MASIRTKFSRKLYVAFGVFLMITLTMAWYFYDSVKWYQYDLQRIAHINELLHGYEELSSITFQQLQSMTDSVMSGRADQGDGSGEAALREAMSNVRQAIVEEEVRAGVPANSAELESLDEIERVADSIFRSGASINQALIEQRPDEAEGHLARLRSDGIASHFRGLIDQAISTQTAELIEAHDEAVSLASYITRLLPILMTILVVLTLVLVYFFSRSLTRSVRVLHEAVAEFTSGNLAHRMPELREREFHELGKAFNTMAQELSDNRSGLHDVNVKLEGMIEERTRALQESNSKLAKVDENRRKLLADISHEFRTPLTVIRGESEIALRGKKTTREEYRESLGRIIDQADHTTRLVDDLLFISRADAGEPRLVIELIVVSKLLDDVCAKFRAKAEERQITIQMTDHSEGAVVRGDAGRLRQVFGILLDNALRYSNAEGAIEAEIKSSGNEVRVSVRDHGIGLTDEEAEKAFERFFRGAQAQGHAQGNGLGLPLAKAIVEAHGGQISLAPCPDQGAVATLTLPLETNPDVDA